jgi:hypothetical protein
MRIARHLLSALALTVLLTPAYAQTGVLLNGSTLWSSDDKIYISGITVGSLGYYDANFQWDAATSSFRLIPDSVQATVETGFPYCPSMRFIDTAADGTTRLSLTADLQVGSWSRDIQLWLSFGSTSDQTIAEGSFTFHPSRLRLIQNGRTYTLTDISSTANPHFVPDNGWLPNLEPLSKDTASVSARIVDFPAEFNFARPFYIYYGSGTPTNPTNNDTYYYCG